MIFRAKNFETKKILKYKFYFLEINLGKLEELNKKFCTNMLGFLKKYILDKNF